jgi:hypothetical protein
MPLDVIGAGLGRTGTTSLKLALERLGFARCHHMSELIFHPETAAWWERAAEGKPVDWEQVLAGYRATVDWPACHFYRELAALYPAARVILTVREPQSWFRSTQATIFSDEHVQVVGERPMAGFMSKAIVPMFDGRLHDREHVIDVFQRHNAQVRRTIAPQRLLVYDVAEGWEPLCRFLGVASPSEPFPRANTTADFRRGRPLPGIVRPPL